MSNTPSSLKLVIFDLDGTVLDTIADLADAVCYALNAHGFPPRSYEEVMSFVGNGVVKLIERALPEGHKDEKTVEAVYESFNERYGAHFADKTRPYAGMADIMKFLKDRGVKLAVLSNKPDLYTKELIEKFYPGLVDIAVGSGENTPRKPDPAGELKIIHGFGFTPDETLHVGDSDTDIMTAKNSGAKMLACSWGYRNKQTLINAGAEIIVDSVEEMAKFFEKTVAK